MKILSNSLTKSLLMLALTVSPPFLGITAQARMLGLKTGVRPKSGSRARYATRQEIRSSVPPSSVKTAAEPSPGPTARSNC